MAEDEYVVASANLAAAVFAERDDKILLLKRAVGEMTGAWYIPGGAVEPGESFEEGALRELREESGLVPTGPLRQVGHAVLPVYGSSSVQVFYAAECAAGEIEMDHEHSEHRWMDAREYRDQYFSNEIVERLREHDPRIGQIVASVRDALDRYLEHRERDWAIRQLRELRLTVEVLLRRDGKILTLERAQGVGKGLWYLPGGAVDPGEDPLDAIVRETLEETGLAIEVPRLLRVWTWPAQNGVEAVQATYVADAPAGDVRLSDEHTGARWVDPAEWKQQSFSPEIEASAGPFGTFIHQVRRNLELLLDAR